MMRVVLAEVLAVAGLSSAGMMVTGGLLADADPTPMIGNPGGGSGAAYIAIGAIGAILSGAGLLFDKWSRYDLSRRESDRLDKTSQEKLDAIEAKATAAEQRAEANEKLLSEVRKQLDKSTAHWHEEREKYSLQLIQAYELVRRVGGQLTSIQDAATANAKTIDVTRKELDLPPMPLPLPDPAPGDAK